MILFLAKPFRVISNATDCAYWVKEVEVNKKGKIENYIIDGRAWEPNRFRGNKPEEYTVICEKDKRDNDYLLDLLSMTENDLYNCLYRVRDMIKEIENEKEE